jgi:hypothetical protein
VQDELYRLIEDAWRELGKKDDDGANLAMRLTPPKPTIPTTSTDWESSTLWIISNDGGGSATR